MNDFYKDSMKDDEKQNKPPQNNNTPVIYSGMYVILSQ